jgi:hypothetical protein
VDLSRIQVIHDWPTSNKINELCNFMVLANFCHRFIWWLSHIAWAMSLVTKGRVKENFVGHLPIEIIQGFEIPPLINNNTYFYRPVIAI